MKRRQRLERQRLEGQSCKARGAWSHQKLRGAREDPPLGLWREDNPASTLVWDVRSPALRENARDVSSHGLRGFVMGAPGNESRSPNRGALSKQ